MWFQALMAVIPAVMAGIGEAMTAGDEARAEQLRQQAMAEYNIDIPPAREIHAEILKSSASQVATPDGSSRLETLRQLSERAAEGYNAEDKAAINDTLSEVNQRERGQRLAITQGMDPNSGAAVAAQLSNQQAGAQRANSQGLAIAGQSRANAMRALMAKGDLAGDIESDTFGRDMARAQAGDAMAQFNQRNSMDAQKFNIGQEGERYDRQFQLANAKAGGKLSYSDYLAQKSQGRRNQMAGIGMAVQQGGLGAYQAGKGKT